ncbi:recombinase family protein [Streptomyces sp. cg36]|uniref:recombinase family protein n=1 Tax=Streptomyces sp. cg36 TaxID=3238798 RepID=UPI0034E1A105
MLDTEEDYENDPDLQDIPETFLSDIEIPDDISELEPYIGYIRVSTWKEEKISPKLQKVAIQEWAVRTKRRIVRWIVDLDKTGRNFKRKIMIGIGAVEQGKVKGIAVWKYSRFGRNRDGIAVNLKRVESVGGQVESATEQIDARTALGKFQRGILFEFAAYESDRAGEQWKETHELRRAAKLPATGRARFGYLWHPRRVMQPNGTWTTQKEWYEPDTKGLGPIVAELYRRYVMGKGFSILCRWLNTAGHLNARGKLWQTETLRRYMDSGFAAGLLRLHSPKCPKPDCHGSCTNYYYAPGAHEEIVGWDLWLRYMQRRKMIKETPIRSRAATYTLTGLMAHDACRKGVTVASATRKRKDGTTYSIPGHGVRCGYRNGTGGTGCVGVYSFRTIIEDRFFEWLSGEAAGIDKAPASEQRAPAPKSPHSLLAEKRKRLQAEVDRISKALKVLMRNYALAPESYPQEEYEETRSEFMNDRAKAQKALDALPKAEELPSAEELRPIVVGLVEEWATLTVDERNAIARQLVRRVVLTRNGEGAKGRENVIVTVHPVWEPDPWGKDETEFDDEQVTEEEVDLTLVLAS